MSEPVDLKIDDEDERRRKDLAALRSHAMQLSEQFDAVEIIACREDGKEGTSHASSGIGNWYTRYGMVRAWMKTEDNRMGHE